ncbi:MAG: hypothetical protein IKO68_13280 [Oscillospiraceae bacterium]|nr:hypothetical protein [Oscillospiraceae bacterium]MBR7009934.1 hypothetical protein [Oscillospiraceae bacterium]
MSRKQVRRTMRYIMKKLFRPGASKHSAKKTGDRHRLIYSYRTYYAFLDVINVLFRWIFQENISIAAPTDLTVDIVIRFLQYKANNCTQTTVDWYRSMLAGLGNHIRAYYCIENYDLHVPRVYAAKKTSGLRGAAATMPRAEYDLILDYCRAHPSGSAYTVLLEEHLAGRVTDVVERMRINNVTVQMKCKGGKLLYRPVTLDMAELLADPRFAAWRTADGGFTLPRSGSVNQFLRRLEKRFHWDYHSFHDIRRLLAQEHYDGLRRMGVKRDRALGLTGLWLNHGPRRQALVLKSYVKNPW